MDRWALEPEACEVRPAVARGKHDGDAEGAERLDDGARGLAAEVGVDDRGVGRCFEVPKDLQRQLGAACDGDHFVAEIDEDVLEVEGEKCFVLHHEDSQALTGRHRWSPVLKHLQRMRTDRPLPFFPILADAPARLSLMAFPLSPVTPDIFEKEKA